MLVQLGSHERIEVVSVEIRFRTFGEELHVVGQGAMIHSRHSGRTRAESLPKRTIRVFWPEGGGKRRRSRHRASSLVPP